MPIIIDKPSLGLKLAKEIKAASPGTLLKDFTATMNSDKFHSKINAVKQRVEDFAEYFPLPGYENY